MGFSQLSQIGFSHKTFYLTGAKPLTASHRYDNLLIATTWLHSTLISKAAPQRGRFFVSWTRSSNLKKNDGSLPTCATKGISIAGVVNRNGYKMGAVTTVKSYSTPNKRYRTATQPGIGMRVVRVTDCLKAFLTVTGLTT
jgi:hypothetical protein